MPRRYLPHRVVGFSSERHRQAEILPEKLFRIYTRLRRDHVVHRRQPEAATGPEKHAEVFRMSVGRTQEPENDVGLQE